MPRSLHALQSKLSFAIASRTASYFDGKAFHSLQSSSESNSPHAAKIIIASRRCYREHRQSYPVKLQKELRTMLKQKAQAVPGTRSMHFIGPWQNNQREVLTLTFNAEQEELFSGAWLIIPETILMSRLLSQGLRAVESPAGTLYFYQHKSDSFKSKLLDYQAAPKGGVIQSAEAAKLAFGVSGKTPVQELAWPMYRSLLAHSLSALPWADIGQFIVSRQQEKQPLPFMPMVVSAVALTAVYLSATSVYLKWLEDNRAAQLASYGSAVSERLAERSQREDEIMRLQALAHRPVDPELVLASYDLLARFQLDGITLNDFSGNYDIVEIRGETRSATDLVTELNLMPQIRNIEFTAPVRRGQSGEMFALLVNLRSDWREAPESVEAEPGEVEVTEEAK